MSNLIQLTFDAASPTTLADFWAIALGYETQRPPPGFESWEAFADAKQIPAEDRDRFAAIVDPEGRGPRVLFLKVPETKTAKNRVHLDVISHEPDEHVERLVAAGATRLDAFEEFGAAWTVMLDPEGNEFCVAASPSSTAEESE